MSRHSPTRAAPTRARLTAAAACREQAATRLQLALVQLEHAVQLMPVGRERVLMERALRVTLHAFRECTRGLRVARAQLSALPEPPLSPTALVDDRPRAVTIALEDDPPPVIATIAPPPAAAILTIPPPAA